MGRQGEQEQSGAHSAPHKKAEKKPGGAGAHVPGAVKIKVNKGAKGAKSLSDKKNDIHENLETFARGTIEVIVIAHKQLDTIRWNSRTTTKL